MSLDVFGFLYICLVHFGSLSPQDLDGAVWLRGEDFNAQVLVVKPQRPINDNGPQLHSAPGA